MLIQLDLAPKGSVQDLKKSFLDRVCSLPLCFGKGLVVTSISFPDFNVR